MIGLYMTEALVEMIDGGVVPQHPAPYSQEEEKHQDVL